MSVSRLLRTKSSLPLTHKPFGLNSRNPSTPGSASGTQGVRALGPQHPALHLRACADRPASLVRRERWGWGLARMEAGPQMLTDSPTARPGRSLRSRSGGREGGGAGFPAGGAEPALEKEEEKGGKGGSGSHGPQCRGPRRANRTPGGAAGKGETAGPELGVSTLEGGHKLTFPAGSAGASVSLLLPSSFAPPYFELPHQSLRRLAQFVPPAALFPWSARAGLGLGVCAALGGHSGGRGSQPDPRHCQGRPPPMSAAGYERECHLGWA